MNGHLIFIYEPFFKKFSAILACKRITIPYLYVRLLEQGNMQKGGFQRIV